MLTRKNLKATTVSSYLSALRMQHIIRGHLDVTLRSPLVDMVLSGRANWDEIQARPTPQRLPMTIKKLELMRAVLELDRTRDPITKAAIMAAACLCFWGSFRMGEILPVRARKVDPENTLLRKDISVAEKTVDGRRMTMLRVKLKSSKESRAYCRGTIIEVFGNGTKTCPVAAFLKYIGLCGNMDQDSSAFRTGDGWALRHARMNRELKMILSPYLSYGSISGHSFRAGIASLMAERGMTDEEIRCQGRWSSESFKRYIKLNRVTRVRIAIKLAGISV